MSVEDLLKSISNVVAENPSPEVEAAAIDLLDALHSFMDVVAQPSSPSRKRASGFVDWTRSLKNGELKAGTA